MNHTTGPVFELDHPFFDEHQPSEVAGIDLFIAETRYRSHGLGANIIKSFILDHLKNFKAIVVDP